MKKIFNFTLVLAILFLVFQFGITIFKSKHSVDYSIKKEDKEIAIHEEYFKDKKVDYYYFELTINKVKFVFDVNNNFNKQKKIIDDVKVYEKDDLMCISPVYIKNNNDPEIVCNINKDQYSYYEVAKNYNISNFIDVIDNYNLEKHSSSNKTVNVGRNKVYEDNMYEDENVLVYNYSYLSKIYKYNDKRINFAKYDIYHNDLGILIDKYYVLPKYENRPEYISLLIINIETEKIEELDIEERLSTNIYINGVVDNKLYLFDKSNLVQYEIDPKKKTYRITGNQKSNAQYYNAGKWETKNIYDFSRQELTFKYSYPVKEKYVEAFETDKFYYYYNNNNEFYKVYKKNLNKPIFLFKFNDMKEVKVSNDCIYFINNNTLYRYDDNGLKKILTNNEFQYNYENIYSVYFK